MVDFIPNTTALSRVWIIEGGARADHAPVYESCMKGMGITQGQGDIEKIECPDPDQFGQFIEIGVVQGAQERETSSLVGRYALDEASTLLRLAKARCGHDYHLNFGACNDARDFSDFQKKLIREDAYFTNYSSDDLGALSSDENAVVNETVDTSSKVIYEVLPLSVTRRADDVIDNPGVDVVICDRPTCASCDDESDGCEIIFVLATNTPGSPGTAPDIIYSIDKAANWAEDDITTLTSAQEANALACVGDDLVVISQDADSLNYKLKSDIVAGTALLWTEVGTGFVGAGSPTDIWSIGNKAFICGDGGYIYYLTNAADGVTVLDAGVATNDDLNAIHALSEKFAVAVGDNDAVIFTLNRTTWNAAAATPASGADLISVWAKSLTEWWAGSSNGELWYTVNQGVTWTQETLPGTLYTAIWDIAFSTKSIGYLGVARTISGTARGQILRTYSGGGGNGQEGGWTILPEMVGTLPANDLIRAIAACTDDSNYVVGTGTADDAADGIIIVGED